MLGFFEKKPQSDPSILTFMELDENLETNVKGIFMAGDITGFPLMKISINQAQDLVERLAPELKEIKDGEQYALVIIGAGAAGISAALNAHENGISYILLEKSRTAETIREFYSGKILLAEPVSEPVKGDLWFEECTREELLEKWDEILAEKNLNIKEGFKATEIKRNKNGFFEVSSSDGEIVRGSKVLIAIGKQGDKRKLGVPGEDNVKVMYTLYDPNKFKNKKILVVGGGDQAAETALALCNANEVTLAVRGGELIRPRKRNIRDLEQKKKEGSLEIYFDTTVKEITEKNVILNTPVGDEPIENDLVFVHAGSQPPTDFLKRSGIRIAEEWTAKRISIFSVVFGAYILFSFFKSFWIKDLLAVYGLKNASEIVSPVLSFLVKYWYGILYTTCVLAFGSYILSGPRRRHYRLHNYVRMRTISCMFFQTLFLFLFPMIPVQYLGSKAFLMITVWPLSLFPASIANKVFVHGSQNPELVFYAFFTVFMAFVAMPIFVYFHGKRYCSWICGCGALAETLGEPFRHLSPKGFLNRRRERIIYIVLFASVIMSGIMVLKGSAVDGETVSAISQWYNLIVYFLFSGIIGVGLYPFFGPRMWCRYLCPLAAYMNLLGAIKTKFGIRSNDRCIDCGQCNRYCEMGIDVKGFALKQERFSLKKTPCIGCGECVAVCPMDVLSFGKDEGSN